MTPDDIARRLHANTTTPTAITPDIKKFIGMSRSLKMSRRDDIESRPGERVA
jgi:hypothetical protein